jgi:hypothetical protein
MAAVFGGLEEQRTGEQETLTGRDIAVARGRPALHDGDGRFQRAVVVSASDLPACSDLSALSAQLSQLRAL